MNAYDPDHPVDVVASIGIELDVGVAPIGEEAYLARCRERRGATKLNAWFPERSGRRRNDTIYGLDGDDVLYGGAGNDLQARCDGPQ